MFFLDPGSRFFFPSRIQGSKKHRIRNTGWKMNFWVRTQDYNFKLHSYLRLEEVPHSEEFFLDYNRVDIL